MPALTSGLIGGAIAIALTAFVQRRVGRSGPPGTLRFGFYLWGVGLGCLMLGVGAGIALWMQPDDQVPPKVALMLFFSIGAIYCLIDAWRVHGTFDEEGIELSSPWTGTKRARWVDLRDIEENSHGGWYALIFSTGTTIRLSKSLRGHLSALEIAIRHLEEGENNRMEQFERSFTGGKKGGWMRG